ncbi:TPA: hypothetical protein ACT9M9_002979, partial [Legionella pneumophila]
KFIFHGLVLPERVQFNISKCKCAMQDIEIILWSSFSKIVVECLVKKSLEINLYTLKNYVEMAVRTIVDSVGYLQACGYDVEIESAYDLQTKDFIIFGVHENIFHDDQINSDTNNGIPHPEISISPTELAFLSSQNLELGIALGDFREAIRQPNFTSFHCYRAIEAIKQAFDGKKDKDKWERLRTNLDVERSDIDKIANQAKFLRHGKCHPQVWKTRKEHMFITWNIIKKYIEFLKSN